MSEYEPDIKEQQRLVVAGVVIATIVALHAVAIEANILSLSRGFMTVPGLLAFCYLVSTGSYLKYKNPGTIGELSIAHSIRRLLYNWMIDGFWVCIFLSVASFVAMALGWDGRQMDDGYFFAGLGIGATIVMLIALISSFLWYKEKFERKK